ncbi:MAG: chlorosome envelope protein B [Chlorobiaceae bacterium]
MSNGSNVDFSGTINNLVDTIGKLAQLQVDVLNNTIKTAAQFIEPLGKTTTDLAGNLVNTFTQVLQGVSSAIAPKK